MATKNAHAEMDPESLTVQCRRFVRSVGTPDRLRQNRIASAVLERAGAHRDAATVLSMALDDALACLTPRERAIVQRCDVERETLARVATDLGITERHLYRERSRIFQKLGALLLSPPASATPVLTESIDAIGRLLKTSRTLEENGALPAAADIIERLALECTQPIDRSRLFLRLAELHGRAGALERAEECVQISIENAKQTGSTNDLLDAETALAQATIFNECGKGLALVSGFADTAIRIVRNSGSFRYDPSSATILARALALRSQVAVMAGDLVTAQRSGDQLQEALTFLRDPDAETRIEALFAQSLNMLSCEQDTSGSAHACAAAIDIANDAGLTLSSLVLSVELASVYRIQGESQRAIALLSSRSGVARAVGSAPIRAMLHIELAGALADCGFYERARNTLDEALSYAQNHDALWAAYLRQSATINFRLNRFNESFEQARAAEDAYGMLGKPRLVGAARRLQADILHSTGQRQAAFQKIRSAIDVISGTNQRLALSRAYEVLWKISGNTRHLDNARRLGKIDP